MTDLITLDERNFDFSEVVDMTEIFYECSSLESVNLDNIDTSKVKYMKEMFSECTALQ